MDHFRGRAGDTVTGNHNREQERHRNRHPKTRKQLLNPLHTQPPAVQIHKHAIHKHAGPHHDHSPTGNHTVHAEPPVAQLTTCLTTPSSSSTAQSNRSHELNV
jgi:hypothetical protein